MKRLVYVGFMAILVSGCVGITPEARQIRIVSNSLEVSACTRIAHVSEKSMACVDPQSCMNAAAARGRNKAAELGATHLLPTFNGISFTHGLFEGDAFKCTDEQVGVQKMEVRKGEPEFVGCTKDIECKGDRICDRGQCVSP